MAGKAATTPAEWALAIGGGLALAIGLVWLLRGGEPESPGPAASQLPAPVAAMPVAPVAPMPPMATPMPSLLPSAMPSTGATAAMAAPTAPATSVQGLKLRGIIARGGAASGAAILETPDGRQRLVRIGQAAAPGLELVSIAASGVTLAAGDQQFQLDLGDARPVASQSPPADNRTRKIMAWKLALAPRRVDGRIDGYTVLPGPLPPLLQRAGLRAGDVLLSVNKGQVNNDGRVEDLEEDASSSYTAEFVFERNGKRQIKQLEVNRRP